MVKSTKVQEKTEPAPVENVKVNNSKKNLFRIAYLLVATLILYTVWKNPELIDKTREMLKSKPVTTEVTQPVEQNQKDLEILTQQIQQLQNQLLASQNMPENTASSDYSKVTERLDAIEKNNLNVIDSKADVAVVLGLITRLDDAEKELNNLAKVSDENALILTAAMLVKDSAERGGSFVYEAEVLKQLTENRTQLKDAVETISKVSSQGINTKLYLVNEFESIYKSLLKEQKADFEKTWKDRLNSKISEIIKVKHVNGEKTPEFKANEALEQVNKYVEGENLNKAIEELGKPANQDLLKNESLKSWYDQVQAKVKFSEAISKISTYTLASMKVNFIKKETNND